MANYKELFSQLKQVQDNQIPYVAFGNQIFEEKIFSFHKVM